MGTDDLIHTWLCEGWFVTLVMSPTAVAYEINQDVFVEVIAVGMSQSDCRQRSSGIISIGMDQGNLKTFSQITGKKGRAALFRLCGETKLVVHNDMNGPTYPVAAQMPEIEGFCYDTLTGEGCIAMNEDGQGLIYILLR